MDGATLVLVALVIVGFAAVALALHRVGHGLRELRRIDNGPSLLMLQTQIEALREQTRASLEGGRLEIDRRLEETNRVVGQVRSGLGAVDRQIQAVGDTARGLQGLQELLRSPKLRGGMGELLLGEMLAQLLPVAHFDMEHTFRSGERVDAVIRVGERLVPVDAKFPLENFQRMRRSDAAGNEPARLEARRAFRTDVRKHVDAIAKRYILPEEGTYEFAMMYLPAEAVYQELLQQEDNDGLDIFHHALNRQVVPVSPQSFFAYLQVIVLGLRGLSLDRRSHEIVDRLASIRTRLDRFTESFDVTVRHLGNAQRQAEEAGRRLARLDAAFDDLSREPDERTNSVES